MSDQKNTHGHEDGDGLGNENSILSLPSFAPPEAVKAQQAQAEVKAAEAQASSVPAVEDKPVVADDGVVPAALDSGADKPATPEGPEEQGAPDAQVLEQAHDVAVASDASAVVVAEQAQPAAAPQIGAEPVDEVVTFDPALAALREIAGKVNSVIAPTQGPSVDADELARVAEHLNLSSSISDQSTAQALTPVAAQIMPQQGAGVATVPVTGGQRAQVNGAAALAEGLGMAVGGAMSLVGAAGRTVGRVAQGIASMANGSPDDAVVKGGADLDLAKASASASLPPVLPRLSEYRIIQAEKAADMFASEQEKFWGSSPKLAALRGEIDRLARERGVPKQDLLEEMKPGGDLAELRKEFNNEVAESPNAMSHKRNMDKALDSYVRQYGRAQEEMLNPEQVGNPHYEGLKGRLSSTHAKMEENASDVPAFAKANGELEKAHFEKLREAVAAIMEKIKEVIQQFTQLMSGKREADYAPAP